MADATQQPQAEAPAANHPEAQEPANAQQPANAPREEQQPAPTEESQQSAPQKSQPAARTPQKQQQPPAVKSPKSRSHSQSVHSTDDNANKPRSQPSDPFVGLTAAERVKLGYQMAKQKFSQRRVSACFASRTGRDPYRVLPPAQNKSPYVAKREEQEQARTEALKKKLHYDPEIRAPTSDFDPNRKEAKRASSWTRDATKRRPFAPRYDIIESSRNLATPGPGAYTSPLAFIGA